MTEFRESTARAATRVRALRAKALRGKGRVAAAWAVHAFTASGVVLGFLALVAIFQGDRAAAFLWLGLALFVDGIDGTLARRLRVKELTPRFDGAALDLVIDYFTYVVVPALMIWWFAMVPADWAVPVAAFVMAASLYTFANVDMKTNDFYFSGFPALWNVVVFYFHILGTQGWVNVAVIAVCGVLTFVPVKVVHPLRVRTLRRVTIPVTVLWAGTSLTLVLGAAEGTPAREAHPLVFWLWVAASVYFACICAWRSAHRAGRR
ncbi:MAG: CDP-alcohol phosphatidyltransferase family protein [Alphaproteobacteria bacterium]|mgnify:FL=1|nr:CDP-alcohol phosphatidyltransferase family protein [Alphaproteobacteria bacterium]